MEKDLAAVTAELKQEKENREKVEKVIDATAAGDVYAAGFLFGCANNKSLQESAKYGSIAAGEIISHFGTRAEKKLSSLI